VVFLQGTLANHTRVAFRWLTLRRWLCFRINHGVKGFS